MSSLGDKNNSINLPKDENLDARRNRGTPRSLFGILTPMILATHMQALKQMQKAQGNEKKRTTLRWLNTVLTVSEYMSFAKSCQEKGCSSQAETWRVKNMLMKDFD